MPDTDAPPASDDREFVSVPEAMRITGLGRTKIYDLITREKVESRKVGKRRLIVRRSIPRLGRGTRDELANYAARLSRG